MEESDGGTPRTKLLIGVLSALLLVVIIIGTVALVLLDYVGDVHNKRTMSSTTRTVDLFCAPTDYHTTCQETLDPVLNRSNDPAGHPHAAAAAAITAVERELAVGFNHSALLDAVRDSNDTLVIEALNDCRTLLDDCRADVNRSLSIIAWHGVDSAAQDLQTWLSAVITFQGSCIDMFPKGEVRDEVKATMERAREISSNAIAIIQQGAAFAAMLDLHTDESLANAKGRKRLLEEELDEEEEGSLPVPSWVPMESRKMLADADADADADAGQTVAGMTPNVTVAKDGTGNYTTISAALDDLPKAYKGTYVIYVKEGVYDEMVNITDRMGNITMYGDGPRKTIITGNKNIADGVRMWKTATMAVDGDRFMAMRLGIRNTAGDEKQQALALRVKSDKTIFFNCRIEGNQDTLFAQAYRQYYRSCIITGTIDFIFGDAAAIFQRCVMIVKRPLPGKPAVVTAHGRRDRQQTTGFVLHRSHIVADASFAGNKSTTPPLAYLGRPWKEHARLVVMESVIDGFVTSQGYMPWDGKVDLGLAFYGEFGNVGKGANATGRSELKGFHVMGRDKAQQFTVGRFLHGADWIPETGTPVRLGLFGS